MKYYDEDQKKVRYKFGFYSLLIMTALLLVYISMPDDRVGGISYQNAIMVIIMISALFFLVNVHLSIGSRQRNRIRKEPDSRHERLFFLLE
ncbi:MAG TPA: hypothetical protein VFW58_07790 [Trichococcus sp.]|nr:hypothetical protein [Trichococcus sp.]